MKAKQFNGFYLLIPLLLFLVLFFLFYNSWSKAKTQEIEHSNAILKNQLRKECEDNISKTQKYYDSQLHNACDNWKYLDKSYNFNSYNDCVVGKLSEPASQQIVNELGAIKNDYQRVVQKCIDQKLNLVNQD